MTTPPRDKLAIDFERAAAVAIDIAAIAPALVRSSDWEAGSGFLVAPTGNFFSSSADSLSRAMADGSALSDGFYNSARNHLTNLSGAMQATLRDQQALDLESRASVMTFIDDQNALRRMHPEH